MWILHPSVGFLSLVQKPLDRPRGTLTIRARVRSDLENLRDRYLPSMGEIVESLDSDYRFRAVAERNAVESAMAALIADIGYSNFKSEVASQQGSARAEIYGHVWHDLYRLQSGQYEEHTAPPLML